MIMSRGDYIASAKQGVVLLICQNMTMYNIVHLFIYFVRIWLLLLMKKMLQNSLMLSRSSIA